MGSAGKTKRILAGYDYLHVAVTTTVECNFVLIEAPKGLRLGRQHLSNKQPFTARLWPSELL